MYLVTNPRTGKQHEFTDYQKAVRYLQRIRNPVSLSAAFLRKIRKQVHAVSVTVRYKSATYIGLEA